MRRGAIVESRHRGHVVQVGQGGAIERAVGDPEVVVALRSSVKPFTLVALLESGASEAFSLTPPELAVMAASHSGEDLHVRTLQAVFRRAGLSQSLLACGTAGMPVDEVTRLRLARDGESPGPLRHMCSGFHAASILLSKHAGWPVQDYWRPEHASQRAARDAVARVFAVRDRDLVTATDACGLPTYAFPLASVARAYAFLADPSGVAVTAAQRALAPALERVRDAMMGAPEMVAGTRDRLDTALMKALPGRLVSKGGAEALVAIGLRPGARGDGSAAAGLAIKIEDGDARGRATHAAAVEALAQIGALAPASLRGLAGFHRPPVFDPQGVPAGEAVPGFELAPILELA